MTLSLKELLYMLLYICCARFQDLGRSQDCPWAFSGSWNGPTIWRWHFYDWSPLLLATNKKPYHGNPTVPFWSPTVAPPFLVYSAPHWLNFVHISKIAFILFSLFFCNFLSYYCYRLGCIIHKLVEFNAYSVILHVSCRPIVYYCILLSLRSVKDETKALITIYLTFFNLPCPATATTATA